MLYNSIGVLYNIDVYSLVLRVNGEWSVLSVNISFGKNFACCVALFGI